MIFLFGHLPAIFFAMISSCRLIVAIFRDFFCVFFLLKVYRKFRINLFLFAKIAGVVNRTASCFKKSPFFSFRAAERSTFILKNMARSWLGPNRNFGASSV